MQLATCKKCVRGFALFILLIVAILLSLPLTLDLKTPKTLDFV